MDSDAMFGSLSGRLPNENEHPLYRIIYAHIGSMYEQYKQIDTFCQKLLSIVGSMPDPAPPLEFLCDASNLINSGKFSDKYHIKCFQFSQFRFFLQEKSTTFPIRFDITKPTKRSKLPFLTTLTRTCLAQKIQIFQI
jgi:hypothetical protein